MKPLFAIFDEILLLHDVPPLLLGQIIPRPIPFERGPEYLEHQVIALPHIVSLVASSALGSRACRQHVRHI